MQQVTSLVKAVDKFFGRLAFHTGGYFYHIVQLGRVLALETLEGASGGILKTLE